MKKILALHDAPGMHWVGDGFPVRSLFSYNAFGAEISPFLLLDYAGPVVFKPTGEARGVGEHPHRGFETVTIVYDGAVAHRDSAGNSGEIGPGDVQWMTAAGGILHQEFHAPAFARAGGPFRMVQLWVNLPAANKMDPPGYQALLATEIPTVALPDGAGLVRVIAGSFDGRSGPARTHTPMNVWDVRLNAGAIARFGMPEGHTAIVVVLSGQVSIADATLSDAQWALLDKAGDRTMLHAAEETVALILTGEPIDEPLVGHGPFVMNTETEIQQAFNDVRTGRFGRIG